MDLQGVGRNSDKRLNPQILLQNLKENLYLPPVLINRRDPRRPEAQMIPQENNNFLFLRIPHLDPSQKIVDEVVHFYNEQRVHLETEEAPQKRWEAAIKAGKSRLRPLDPAVNVDLAFSLHYKRMVKKDGTFSFQGKEYKLRHLAGTRVIVGLIPDRKLLVIKDGQRATEFPL